MEKLVDLVSKKKVIVVFGAIGLLAVVILIFISTSRRKKPSIRQETTKEKVVERTPDIIVSNISPLQRTIIGKTQTKDVDTMQGRTTKQVLSDGTVEYAFETEYPQRTDTIVAKDDVVTFERRLLPEDTDSVGYATLVEYAFEYGEAERVVQGSEFWGPFVSAYIYASRGFALIGNPFTDEVYEIHLFAPTTVEDYIQRWGSDIYEATPAPENFSLPEDGGSVQGVSAEDLEPQAIGDTRAWPLNIVESFGEFTGDALCAFLNKCGLSDLDKEIPEDVPTPTSGLPEPTVTGAPRDGDRKYPVRVDYFIPFRESRIDKVNIRTDAKTRIKQSWPSAMTEEYFSDIIKQSRAAKWNPAFVLTLWVEETGGSTKTAKKNKGKCTVGKCALGHLGCAPKQNQTMEQSLNCLFKNFSRFEKNDAATFRAFMERYSSCGRNPDILDPDQGPFWCNPNFPKNIKYWYQQLVPTGPGVLEPL